MKTKLPSAIVYGWYKLGKHILKSSLYSNENLDEDVIVYSLINKNNIESDKIFYDTNIVIYFDEFTTYINDVDLANEILKKNMDVACKNEKPYFSIFTPTYETYERIYRTYNSILNQTFKDWEWVVLDDSKDDQTWKLLIELSNQDNRIKPHKIYPLSGGNVGLVKNRATSLCDGEWLVELDHDDELFNNCLIECYNAILKYPDSEFLYSDFCGMYENGEMLYYDHKTDEDWYGRSDNNYAFGYAGNKWEIYNNFKYLRHHFCDINPLTIRYNASMPNHVRVWKKSFYNKIGGHNKLLPIADDYELIIKSFLHTRIVHIKKMLYLQWSNNNSTTNNNWKDINRRCRLIKDFYDKEINQRILELGYNDWNWNYEKNCSYSYKETKRYFYDKECVLNYVYE